MCFVLSGKDILYCVLVKYLCEFMVRINCCAALAGHVGPGGHNYGKMSRFCPKFS